MCVGDIQTLLTHRNKFYLNVLNIICVVVFVYWINLAYKNYIIQVCWYGQTKMLHSAIGKPSAVLLHIINFL